MQDKGETLYSSQSGLAKGYPSPMYLFLQGLCKGLILPHLPPGARRALLLLSTLL